MLLGNLLCRTYVMRRGVAVDSEAAAELREAVRSEGCEQCSLEPDEADALFDRCYSFADRLFSHSTVQGMAHSFARELQSRRRMAAAEVFELLSALGKR